MPLRAFLIDLEYDLPAVEAVVAELRRMERDGYQHSSGSVTARLTVVSSEGADA